MFTPQESVAALRAYRELKTSDGRPLVWRDPAQGGYGMAERFNLAQPTRNDAAAGTASRREARVASDDNVSIDAGVLLVALENARSGLVWRLFMEHDVARRAVERLRFTVR
jgi:hypothetical protein